MRYETWLKTDLKELGRIVTLDGVVFSQDDMANLIGVEVYDDGQPATLSGTVTGYVIRDDGATVSVTGSITGNKASIILPESAYAVVGALKIAIRLTNGDDRTTLCACTGTVIRTTTDAIVDPGHTIPSLDELLAQLDACIQATEAAEDAADAIEDMTVDATGLPSGSNPTATITTVDGHYNISFGLVPAVISSQTTQYQNSTSGTTVPSGTWLDSQPTTPQGQFLWVKRVITWGNGQTVEMYSVSRMGVDGTGSVSSVNGESPDANGNVQLAVDNTPTARSTNLVTSGGVKAALDALVDLIYPVGSVYMSFASTDPGTLFGGTWVALEECFLFASGETYTAEDTGGELEHTLTESELPNITGQAVIRAWGNGDSSTVHSASGAFSKTTGSYSNTLQTLAGNGTWFTQVANLNLSFGSGAAHNNMPPYTVVNMWRRTA